MCQMCARVGFFVFVFLFPLRLFFTLDSCSITDRQDLLNATLDVDLIIFTKAKKIFMKTHFITELGVSLWFK